VELRLGQLYKLRPSAIEICTLGGSCEGRPIRLVTLGTGPRRALMWTQMHGDEPTHTAATLDLMAYLQVVPHEQPARSILAGCTLSMIPMLNPDGAERWTRENAQGLDVNRDARNLATPEGRILRDAVAELQPEFGFNLHNHHPRTTIAGTTQTAAASLLVPPIDDAGTFTDAMHRAAQVAGIVAGAIGEHCGHAVARYRAEYMPTAFGEWVQSQDTSTVLVEAGGWQGHRPGELVALHWAGLLAALTAIADGSYAQSDSTVYQELPLTDPPPSSR
jgi:hypothetical protein